MDASVREELGHRDAGHLPAHGVERREGDGVGRVVDDDVDAGGVLERADVAALAADDAPLHVLGRQRDDGDGVLRDDLARQALHRRGDDLAGALVRLFFDFLLDLAKTAVRLVADLVLNLREQHLARLHDRQIGETFELEFALFEKPGKLLALRVEFALFAL